MILRRLLLTGACCVAGIFSAGGGPHSARPRLLRAKAAQDAAAGASQPSVVETQWNLIELNGSAVNVPGYEGQVYIYLQQEGDKLSGSDGCNRFFGSYDLSGGSLQFHSVAQTLMACRGAFTDREAEFVDALKLVTSYQISENVLQLKVDDRVLARFQARKK